MGFPSHVAPLFLAVFFKKARLNSLPHLMAQYKLRVVVAEEKSFVRKQTTQLVLDREYDLIFEVPRESGGGGKSMLLN